MSECPWEFPALRQPVRIATYDGDRQVDGATLGGLAVTRSTGELVETGAPWFVITHMATGKLVSGSFGFGTEAEAIGAMRALVALPVDWRAEPFARPEGFGDAWASVLAVWGAFLVEDAIDGPGGHA